MPCLLGCLALGFPRLVIILLVIFSDYIGAANQTVLWPLLGFFFAPTTTLAYAFAINSHGSVSGVYAVLLVFAVLLDLGLLGSGGYNARRSTLIYRDSGGVKRVRNTADNG